MISNKSSLSLQAIAKTGASLEVDALKLSSLSLQAIAKAGSTSNAKLVVHNSDKLSSLSMQAISKASPGNVTFK